MGDTGVLERARDDLWVDDTFPLAANIFENVVDEKKSLVVTNIL